MTAISSLIGVVFLSSIFNDVFNMSSQYSWLSRITATSLSRNGYKLQLALQEQWLIISDFNIKSATNVRVFVQVCFVLNNQGGGQDHVHHPFVRRNAKSFYCLLPWEKAGLHFQCILKSILHKKTTNELPVSLYSTTCLY